MNVNFVKERYVKEVQKLLLFVTRAEAEKNKMSKDSNTIWNIAIFQVHINHWKVKSVEDLPLRQNAQIH